MLAWPPQPPTAKIAVAVQDELGRLPTPEEVEQVVLRTWVRGQAVLGRLSRRQQRRQTGQLAIF